MPRRTNVFQEVVAIIQQHMAGDATVEESGMLKHRATGKEREVDVVIRSRVAGHEVIVSVEATDSGRKADTTWVESRIEKHRNLPTSKLVLVSQLGFTGPARTQAEAEHVVALAPEDLDVEDPAFVVVNALSSLWPKVLSFSPETATLMVRTPAGTLQRVRDVQPDTWVFLADGQKVGTVLEVFKAACDANFPRIAEMVGLADITEDLDRFFVLGYGPPWAIKLDGENKDLYLGWEQSDPPELHEIQQAEFRGKATIRVGEIPLRHRRLGEVAYAYGEGEIGERPVLIVVSEDEGGGKATIRVRPAPEQG
jgi:hypothetical protein